MMKRPRILAYGSAGILVAMTGANAAQAEYFSQSYYSPTSGRVGYHMVASLHSPMTDRPKGCVPEVNGFDTQGTLPPGLAAPVFVPYAENVGKIEGTPRQPGDWDITVTLKSIKCTNTGEQFGDRPVNIHLHIDP